MKKMLRNALLLSTVGPVLLAESCAMQIRDAAITAGAAFVGTAVSEALNALIQVDQIVGAAGG